MIAVVLDTNILISALLTPSGPPAQVLLLCIANPGVELCVSPDLYAEYEEMIHRPKFKRIHREIGEVLKAIRQHATWVSPSESHQVCADPDDNMILDCAHAAKARYIVSGNLRHFPTLWATSQIVTAREFLDALQ